LSGNVTVAYVPATNTVNITGDNKANEILLRGSLTGGTYTILGAAGTRVNGGESFSLPVVGANGASFNISLGNGADVVRLGAVSPQFFPFTANAVSITTGNGDDTVSTADTSLRGGLNVSTGNGDDLVRMVLTDILAGQTINTGNGDDTVTIDEDVNILTGSSVINAGRGFDQLNGRANLNVVLGTRQEIGFE
jgi:hypothetical protein